MTSSSPSPESDPAGFARHDHEGERIPLTGLFTSDVHPPLGGGVLLQDMPTARPAPRPVPRVKGVPGATRDAAADQPGQGSWREA